MVDSLTTIGRRKDRCGGRSFIPSVCVWGPAGMPVEEQIVERPRFGFVWREWREPVPSSTLVVSHARFQWQAPVYADAHLVGILAPANGHGVHGVAFLQPIPRHPLGLPFSDAMRRRLVRAFREKQRALARAPCKQLTMF